jgi:hypothetical protein
VRGASTIWRRAMGRHTAVVERTEGRDALKDIRLIVNEGTIHIDVGEGRR